MFKKIMVIAAALLIFVSFAEARSPEKTKAALTNTLNQRFARTINWYRKTTAKLLKNQKNRKRPVAFCINSKADFDYDGDVDSLDQQFFGYCFDTSGKGIGCKAADYNNDGAVTLSDMIAFADEMKASGDATRADLCVVVASSGAGS